jgi:hypothetical protein
MLHSGCQMRRQAARLLLRLAQRPGRSTPVTYGTRSLSKLCVQLLLTAQECTAGNDEWTEARNLAASEIRSMENQPSSASRKNKNLRVAGRHTANGTHRPQSIEASCAHCGE